MEPASAPVKTALASPQPMRLLLKRQLCSNLLQRRPLSKYKIRLCRSLKKATANRSIRLDKEITENARTLEQTLESFGIQTHVVHATQGPSRNPL
jgi:hypothetical protein